MFLQEMNDTFVTDVNNTFGISIFVISIPYCSPTSVVYTRRCVYSVFDLNLVFCVLYHCEKFNISWTLLHVVNGITTEGKYYIHLA
jgi:hypothetical protein